MTGNVWKIKHTFNCRRRSTSQHDREHRMYKVVCTIFIILLLLLPWQVAGANTTPMMRIIGGNEVRQNTFSSVVAIKDTVTGKLVCGGNLIHPIWVLTAAHCVQGEVAGLSYKYTPPDMVIFSGAINLDSSKGRHTNVSRIVVHPYYNPRNGTNDLALLQLSAPLEGATMPIYSNNPPPGTAATVVGWGARQANGWGTPQNNRKDAIPANYPRSLQQATIPIIDNKLCNRPTAYAGKIQGNMLCAGLPKGGKDACQGVRMAVIP